MVKVQPCTLGEITLQMRLCLCRADPKPPPPLCPRRRCRYGNIPEHRKTCPAQRRLRILRAENRTADLHLRPAAAGKRLSRAPANNSQAPFGHRESFATLPDSFAIDSTSAWKSVAASRAQLR